VGRSQGEIGQAPRGGTYVDEAEGLAERVSEEADEFDVEQFRVEQPDTQDAGRGRQSCAR